MQSIILSFKHAACVRAVILLSALLTTSTLSATWLPSLSEHDLMQLGTLAKQQHLLSQGSIANTRTATTLAKTTLGVEVLMVELQEKKKRKPNDSRLAEVFIFDYTTNSASVQLINADTNELVKVQTIDHIHLPLNQREQDVATELLLGNTELIEQIKTEYFAQFNKTLSSPALLEMKVSIWEPGINYPEASDCKQTRCALVSVFTHDSYNFSIEPVIELRNAKVHLDFIQ